MRHFWGNLTNGEWKTNLVQVKLHLLEREIPSSSVLLRACMHPSVAWPCFGGDATEIANNPLLAYQSCKAWSILEGVQVVEQCSCTASFRVLPLHRNSVLQKTTGQQKHSFIVKDSSWFWDLGSNRYDIPFPVAKGTSDVICELYILPSQIEGRNRIEGNLAVREGSLDDIFNTNRIFRLPRNREVVASLLRNSTCENWCEGYVSHNSSIDSWKEIIIQLNVYELF